MIITECFLCFSGLFEWYTCQHCLKKTCSFDPIFEKNFRGAKAPDPPQLRTKKFQVRASGPEHFWVKSWG